MLPPGFQYFAEEVGGKVQLSFVEYSEFPRLLHGDSLAWVFSLMRNFHSSPYFCESAFLKCPPRYVLRYVAICSTGCLKTNGWQPKAVQKTGRKVWKKLSTHSFSARLLVKRMYPSPWAVTWLMRRIARLMPMDTLRFKWKHLIRSAIKPRTGAVFFGMLHHSLGRMKAVAWCPTQVTSSRLSLLNWSKLLLVECRWYCDAVQVQPPDKLCCNHGHQRNFCQ